MLKIGEFSKLSHLTVKALRFYEKEGILLPASTDKWTGYRLYETAQLEAAASVKAYRQLGLSIEEIRAIQAGADVRQLLTEKAKALTEEKRVIDSRLSIIHHILEDTHWGLTSYTALTVRITLSVQLVRESIRCLAG